MNSRKIISLIATFALAFTLGISGQAIADEEILGRQAEEAGKHREALTHYVSALQSASEGSSKDQQLREKIIKLSREVQPSPAIPEEAERFMARGQAAVEIAQKPEDFRIAITEFQKAVRSAPWLADGYYNLGLVQEKAGQTADAVRSLKLYLLAAPNAADKKDVELKIVKLEFKEEQFRTRKQHELEKAKVQQERKQSDQEMASRMAGYWETTNHTGQRYKIETSGNRFELYVTSWDNYRRHGKELVYYGTVQDGTISGYYNLTHGVETQEIKSSGQTYNCVKRAGAHPMDRGSLSPDGNRLTLHHIVKDSNPNCTSAEIEYPFYRVQ